MAWGMAEGILTNLKTYLETNFPAKLDELDVEYSDGILLEDIKEIYLGPKSLQAIPSFPVVALLPETATVGLWNAQRSEMTVTLTFGVLLLDQDHETMQRRVLRYGRAAWELLTTCYTSRSLGGIIVGRPTLEYEPIITNNSDFLAEILIRFQVEISEQR